MGAMDSYSKMLNTLAGSIGMASLLRRFKELKSSWDIVHDAHWGNSTNLARWSRECDVREQLGSCISISLESLYSACYLISELKAVNTQYSVIRTAIEASSTGIWLCCTGTKNKMIFHSLKLAYRDNHNIMETAQMFKEGNRELIANRSQTERYLKDRQSRLKGYAHRDISNFPKYTQIVKRSDEIVKRRKTYDAVRAWKLCSSLAHGSRDVMIGLSYTTPTGVSDDKTMEVTASQNTLLSAACLNTAVENCECLLSHYEQACSDSIDTK